jgi:hypothetical protein
MTQVPRSTGYRYFINLDERGSFSADVRNPRKRTIFEIHGFRSSRTVGCCTAATSMD